MELVLLRHGQTEWNHSGIVIGKKDIPLDKTGRKQAYYAAELLAASEVDAIYSSPLIRSRETAEIVGRQLDLDVNIVPELSERNWGIFEGRPRSERDVNGDPKGGETLVEFQSRVAAALPFIRGLRPLVVTHSGVIRLLVSGSPSAIPHAIPIRASID